MIRRARVPLAVAAGGFTLALVLALSVPSSANDAALLVGFTALFSIVAALAGRWYVAFRKESSLRNQILVVSTSSIATVAVGTLAAARAMFISVHDLNALFAVMSMAAAVAIAASLSLAGRFDTETRAVTMIAEGLVERSNQVVPAADFRIREMRDLANRLDQVSAELISSQERERALERSRRELVSWVSHDLRSPLASIRALAEALVDGIAVDDEDRVRYCELICREAERLTGLVDDLFVLSRIQAGTAVVVRPTIGVPEVVDDAVASIRHRAEANGVRVECDIASIGDRKVPSADVTRVLRNLLDNAVRHTRHGGLIVVEGHAEDDAIVLSVLDECGGIPESDITRVFDTAYRGDTARRRDGGGGGLGLAIARGLVEAHAGRIDVRNHKSGCQFSVRIPKCSVEEH